MENSDQETVEVMGQFLALMQMSKNRSRAAYNYILQQRPRRLYCSDGYSSLIFQAVMRKDNRTTKIHLRLSIRSLEKVMEYGANFLNTERGWSHYFQVTVFIYWLACGASYGVTGASFNISITTVRDIVHKCLKGFLNLMPSVIQYPSEDQFPDIALKFNQSARTHIFTQAVGAIDGTHVAIAVPTRIRDQYMNRKSFTSLQLQVVCTSSMEFISISCGYPGSVHDERVLKNSDLFKMHSYPPQSYYLLGDSGYACRKTPISIITPYKRTRPITAQQRKFNELHSKARSVVESAIGMLKQRWRAIFDKALHLKIQRCIQTIAVACVMHNICLNDDFEFEMPNIAEINESDSDQNNILFESDQHDAIRMRNEIANNL